MYTPLKLAALALPFASAVPLLGLLEGDKAGPLTGDSVTDILKNGMNLVEQVNANLGNILPTKISSTSQLQDTLNKIRDQQFEDGAVFATFAGLLQAVVQDEVTKSIPNILSELSNFKDGATTIENVAGLLLNSLSVTDLTQNVLAGYLPGMNSFNNQNPPPKNVIYPRKQANDPAYTISQADLQAALYIPPGFTYGVKRPVLFVPGTASFGGINFASNLGKLLSNDDRFDPVYLNVPGAMLNSTLVNVEYIAYAINYLSSITNRSDLAVIPWSQGNLDVQWVLQYWRSTRKVVTDFISASADFHGTTLAYLLDPSLVNPPLPPSIYQQKYDSNYVLTLLLGGGHSPYVPSTSVHSITDEVVQPQFSPYASADYYTQDLPGTPNTYATCSAKSNVAYTNAEIQTVCAGYPGAAPYTHEGVLYNPLMYALAIDALTHDGPGQLSRIDIPTVCSQLVAPGLSATDVLATEGIIPLAALNILLYPGKVTTEPAVSQYATAGNANCNAN